MLLAPDFLAHRCVEAVIVPVSAFKVHNVIPIIFFKRSFLMILRRSLRHSSQIGNIVARASLISLSHVAHLNVVCPVVADISMQSLSLICLPPYLSIQTVHHVPGSPRMAQGHHIHSAMGREKVFWVPVGFLFRQCQLCVLLSVHSYQISRKSMLTCSIFPSMPYLHK